MVREKTLYDVVSKYLNHLTPYKEWLEPFLEKSQVLLYPKRTIQWKGFNVKNDKRINFDFNLQLGEDGKVLGFGKSKKGEYKIEGEHNYKTIKFKKTLESKGKKKITSFKGNFVDILTVEGTYNYGKTSGNFRIWISDELCPGLSVIQGDQSKKKKINPLPDEHLTWKGYWIQSGHQGDMNDLQIKLDPNGKVTGKGLDQHGPFVIDGYHRNYADISFTKKNGYS